MNESETPEERTAAEMATCRIIRVLAYRSLAVAGVRDLRLDYVLASLTPAGAFVLRWEMGSMFHTLSGLVSQADDAIEDFGRKAYGVELAHGLLRERAKWMKLPLPTVDRSTLLIEWANAEVRDAVLTPSQA